MSKTNIFFKSDAHRARFLLAMQESGKVYDGKFDVEYCSALYILTSGLATWDKAKSYVDRDGIDIEGMLEEMDFSSGQAALIKLAGNLFNGQMHIDPVDLATDLDNDNFHVALTALQLRRVSLRAEDFQ